MLCSAEEGAAAAAPTVTAPMNADRIHVKQVLPDGVYFSVGVEPQVTCGALSLIHI